MRMSRIHRVVSNSKNWEENNWLPEQTHPRKRIPCKHYNESEDPHAVPKKYLQVNMGKKARGAGMHTYIQNAVICVKRRIHSHFYMPGRYPGG